MANTDDDLAAAVEEAERSFTQPGAPAPSLIRVTRDEMVHDLVIGMTTCGYKPKYRPRHELTSDEVAEERRKLANALVGHLELCRLQVYRPAQPHDGAPDPRARR